MESVHACSHARASILCKRKTGFAAASARSAALVASVAAFFLVNLPVAAGAQKVYSIGSLNTAEQFVSAFQGFKTRLGELGYRENHNVRYQFYNSRGKHDLLVSLAEKLVQDKVDLIVTSSTSATAVAAKATEKTRIPVLFLGA
jgi:ABC-type uncharacterized transport system substrate-binding protein